MPASLFGELDHNGHHSLEDQRALQLALELSMLGLANEPALSHGLNGNNENGVHHSSGVGNDNPTSYFSSSQIAEDIRNLLPKKSQNMTECVPVPSSEHVAEIVGRQGCKIKALRAKTNTYIKTPVRGEEPVFVVTGRKEDVAQAKREILSAAEHFSQIRASRKGGSANGTAGNGVNTNGTATGPPSIPGQITIQVRVPYRVVGLVVGPKGATIKRIQQQTNTYIMTPSRDKDPVFEVTGLPDNVQVAKREIEAHIAIRTGTMPSDSDGGSGTNSLDQELSSSQLELLANLYKNGTSGFGLEGLGFGLINSLSSSLSSVSGLGDGGNIIGNNGGENGVIGSGGGGGGEGNSAGTASVGSSSSSGGSLSSLSSLNGFNALNGTEGSSSLNSTVFGQVTDWPFGPNL